IDTARDKTDFTVLAARAFEAPPVASVRLGHRIPPGFHGNWFPADDPSGTV
ncbi:MAG: carotenoid oxygenase family protein, partial [Parafilimonas terrae]|nr:carotenoid oxygenase family protein [Parafilimonas terrae]